VSKQIYRCTHCNANWTSGEFSDDCEQCGGGALVRACWVCGGRCGGQFTRSVLDSWDTGIAHWVGACKLSSKEK